MLSVLASGTLVTDSVARTTSAGKPYCAGLMRVPCDDGEPVLASLIAFSTAAVEQLLAHAKGDTVAVAGRAKLSTWQGKDGAEVHGLNIVVDKVLSAYMLDKKRTQAQATEAA
jgi:single-stranded DNA-binding protein